MSNREDVEDDVWRALERHGLGHCLDGVMDSLDTVVDWADDDGKDDD